MILTGGIAWSIARIGVICGSTYPWIHGVKYPRPAQFVVAALALIAAGGCRKELPPLPSWTWSPLLQQELRVRLIQDQAIRDSFLAEVNEKGHTSQAMALKMWAVDSANQAWLKPIITQHGWPRREVLDSLDIQAVFLIVQHADRDPHWQAQLLPSIVAAHDAGDLDGQSVALLTDRVLKAQGRPQVYGTQTTFQGSTPVFDPIEDSANVDARRAKMGLPPLAVYKRMLDSMVASAGKN